MFTLTGQWNEVTALVRNMRDDLLFAQRKHLEVFGFKMIREVLLHIKRDDLNWARLNPDYLARKIREGYSEKIYVASNTYRSNITSTVIRDTVYVGFKIGTRNKDGESYGEYGSYLEWMRPLWSVTFDEVIKWQKTNNNPNTYFAQRIRQRYGYEI